MRQLLQNETKSSYQKFITKCDRGLLQSATDCYYKVRQALQSVTGRYYKVRQVLQSVTVITKWDLTASQANMQI